MARAPKTKATVGSKKPAALSIAVILPCYKETAHILDVIKGIGPCVSAIYVVDDDCPDQTGAYVEKNCKDRRVRVIFQKSNTGVGGAMVAGYQAALQDNHDIFVKMDGDGQMDASLIPTIIAPLVENRADYAKGNRFHKIEAVSKMPVSRIFGNICLSFLSKMSSGYWSVFDPTNGFTALHRTAARRLPLEQLSKGYFFESDMLFRLAMIRAVIEDVPMNAIYGNEKSGIRIPKIIPEFIVKHFISTCKRLYFTYFLRDFGLPGLQLILGGLMFGFGVIFGLIEWYHSSTSGIPATAGTVIVAALPVILGSQFLISFLNHDTRNAPTKPLQSDPSPLASAD
ncbi:MAG: glycosyltransferase family 2 protein [Rhodospirillales bacterium]|nr:glycosyltransferase family 2 protein [Rhodospirillales bacterium]